MNLNIDDNNSLALSVADQDELSLSAGEVTNIGGAPFDGPYEYTPSEEAQTIPISGLEATEDIVIDAVPSDFVGSEVPRKASADMTASGDTVTAPAGYYEEAASKAVAHGSAKAPEGTVTVNPTLSVDDEGVITATVNKDLTLTPTVVPGYVEHGTSGILTAQGNTQYQMYKRTSDDLTVSNGVVTAPDGYYPQNASKKVDLKPVLLRPDAELVQTYTYDKYAHEDEGITIPAYSTSAQTIIASANLSPTVTLDYNNYSYYVVQRYLAIPEYSISTKAKGRVEYYFASYIYDVGVIAGGTYKALVNNTTSITGRTVIAGATTSARLFYWTSGTALGVYSSTSTGLYMTPVAPAISSGVMTLKSPTCATKGSGTYFSSTYANAVTDIRFQYVFEVWRSPRNNFNVNGFSTEQNHQIIADCVNSATHKLT